MPNSQYSTTIQEIRSVILSWLNNQLSADALNWLKKTGEELKNNPEDWQLFISFSSVPRHTGKEKINATEKHVSEAESHRKGWDISSWTVDQLGRSYLLLCYAENGKEQFFEKLNKIFDTSDMGESVALYQSLPILPWPDDLKYRTAEGVRSNITSVFNAVALNNPYPKEYLEEAPWNQIVLKAMFVESPLYKMVGLDERANKTLAKILVEYAHERISAGRSVSPELWRPVGPFIDEEIAEDINWLMNQPDDLQKQAGILAIRSSNFSGKEALLKKHAELAKEVDEQQITWDEIGKRFHADKQ